VKRRGMEGVFSSGIAGSYESRATGPDGTTSWFLNHLGPIFAGDKVGSVVIVGMDISRQKAVEAEVMSHRQQLESLVAERTRQVEQAKERYRTVANFTFDWETWDSPDGELLYVSPSCRRITGYTAGPFGADRALLRRIILPEDLPRGEEHNHARQKGPIEELPAPHRHPRQRGGCPDVPEVGRTGGGRGARRFGLYLPRCEARQRGDPPSARSDQGGRHKPRNAGDQRRVAGLGGGAQERGHARGPRSPEEARGLHFAGGRGDQGPGARPRARHPPGAGFRRATTRTAARCSP
jgi:PAS domain-containing protein